MAVLPSNTNRQTGNTANSGNNTTTINDFDELKPITLEELKRLGLTGPAVQLDLEEDAWAFNAPPPKGRYKLRIYLAQDGMKMGYIDPKKQDPNDFFITAPLQCKIVSDDPEIDGSLVFPRVNTRIYRNKNISTMMGLVVKGLGPKAINKSNLTTYEQTAIFTAFLKKEPIVEADLDWRGSYQLANGEWENVFKHYEGFPRKKDGSGGREHEVEINGKDGTLVEIRAQIYVANWYAKGEASKIDPRAVAENNLAGGNGMGGGVGNVVPMIQPVQQVVQPSQPVQQTLQPVQQTQGVPTIPLPTVNQATAMGQAPTPSTENTQQVDDDLALLLSGE